MNSMAIRLHVLFGSNRCQAGWSSLATPIDHRVVAGVNAILFLVANIMEEVDIVLRAAIYMSFQRVCRGIVQLIRRDDKNLCHR